jgi:hypothetical protein
MSVKNKQEVDGTRRERDEENKKKRRILRRGERGENELRRTEDDTEKK